MLQNRVHGYVALHSIALFVLLVSAFGGVVLFFDITRLVILHANLNHSLYLLGIVVSAVSIHHHLRGQSQHYGRGSLRDVVRLTGHQITRLMLMIFAIAFVTKDVLVSRTFILSFIAASAAGLLIANLLLPKLLAVIFVPGCLQRTVIVAPGATAAQLNAWLTRFSGIGIELVGFLSDQPNPEQNALRWIGRVDELDDIVQREGIDQILIDQNCFQCARTRALVEQCEGNGCRVRSFIDVTTLLHSANAAFSQDGRYAFATTTPEPLDSPLNQAVKRLLDIAISLPVILLILPPVMLMTAIVQRRQAPGPILYSQWRTGINRRRFKIFKLRTMYIFDANNAAQQATRNDSRVYPFGRFLRRSSLDELPQFLNVLRGEMSVSGPRPHLIEHDELFARTISTYRKRHFVKPGITGLAQAKGCRGEVGGPHAIKRRVRYDMHYIARWSLLMDVRIIVQTIRQILIPPSSAY